MPEAGRSHGSCFTSLALPEAGQQGRWSRRGRYGGPYIGLFLLPTMLVVMLAAERLAATQGRGSWIGPVTITGTTLLFVGGMFWVFVNPALYGPGYWLSTAGILVTGAAALGTIWHGGLARIAGTRQALGSALKPLPH